MLDSILLDNNGLAALIAFALVLIPAVVIHELGHFLAGKAVGITILEFGIGFPPRIGRLFTWRETEFTLNWLPLGGFVRPLGEDIVRQKDDDDVDLDRLEAQERGITELKSVNDAKPLERILFLSSGAIANLISAFVVFVAVGMLGVVGVRVHAVYVDSESPLGQAGLQSNDVIESVGDKTFINAEELFIYLNELPQGETVDLTVFRGEDGDQIIIPYTVPDTGVAAATVSRDFVQIAGVVENSPAAEAGFEAGDLITGFNNENIDSIGELIRLTNEGVGETVSVELLRSGESITTSLVPRVDPPEGEGAMGIEINTVTRDAATGVIYQPILQQVIVHLSFSEAVQYSVMRFNNLFSAIIDLPRDIARNGATASDLRPVSIVGISQFGGVFLQQSIEEQRPVSLLNYIAVISIALGLTNLLPLPALDGGRILFVLIEMVRGRPIPPEREGLVHLLGLVFLLSLTVVVIINDIINPVTDLIP